jgi:hypothetical protein
MHRMMESLVTKFESSVRRIVREELSMMNLSVPSQTVVTESKRPTRGNLPDKLMSKYRPPAYHGENDPDGYSYEDEDDQYEQAPQRGRARTGLNPIAEAVLRDPDKRGFIDNGKGGNDERPLRINSPEQLENLDKIFREYDDFEL